MIKIGSRKSRLALVQVDEILLQLKSRGIDLAHERVAFETRGDVDKTTPLTANPGDDFFTNTLDEAVLNGTIDLAVHSAKDLPKHLRAGLDIFALTEGLDDSDAWVGRMPWPQLPNGAKIGSSSMLRQKSIKELRPDVQIVDIRGTIDERLKIIDDKIVDGIIVAACALKRLQLENKITNILPWEGTPLQGQLAVVGRSQDIELKRTFAAIDVRPHYGKVYLVGAGPGDRDLITLKAVKLLERADTVIYDYLVDPYLLKYALRAEHIYAGKRKGQHTISQAELSRLLKSKALEGKQVVRLKGGDPLIFGRGAEEMAYLRDYHIPVEIIPGVSSATGIPSTLGLPLTARGLSSSVAFVSAHGEDEKNAVTPVHIPDCETLVFFMGLTKLTDIVRAAKEKGWAGGTPFMIISNGTRNEERVITATLATIEDACRKSPPQPPGLIIIGKVVDLYHPKRKRTILHTGTFPDKYWKLGRVIEFPMIEIRQCQLSDHEKNTLVNQLKEADLILLTSRYTIDALLKHNENIIDILKKKTICVIGGETAASLFHLRISPALIADEENSEGFLKAIIERFSVHGKLIVFPRSALPNPLIKTQLTQLGATVIDTAVYLNVKPAKRALPEEAIEDVIFTSPSTVRNFLEDYAKIPAHWTIFARGPATQNELLKSGYECRLMEEYNE